LKTPPIDALPKAQHNLSIPQTVVPPTNGLLPH